MAGYQVPARAAGQGIERKTKCSWDRIRAGRDHSPITDTSEAELTQGN